MDFMPCALFLAEMLVQLLTAFFSKRIKVDPREAALRLEIKNLNREADALSAPSTFAQSAKLKRAAASKEKELTQLKEKLTKRKTGLHQTRYVVLTCVYSLLAWWFWTTPVTSIPTALVQPFGSFIVRFLGWPAKSQASETSIKIGVLPWLMLSARVSVYLSDLLLTRSS